MNKGKSQNVIQVISPYWCAETQHWVFDDPRVSLEAEPFIAGIPEMIEDLVQEIPQAQSGFILTFSTSPFPGYQRKLTFIREEWGGAWYRSDQPEREGWLCPALYKYFHKPPAEIYVSAAAKKTTA